MVAFVSLAGMRVPLVLVVLAALVFLPSCGSGSGKGAAPAGTTVDPASYTDKTAQRTVIIDARDDLFAPQYTKIRVGTTVVFENGGRNPHNLISVDKSFPDIESDAFAPAMKATVVFDKAGTHDFYCSLHGSATAGMRGSLLVVP